MPTAKEVYSDTKAVLDELLASGPYPKGAILVVSCSISRVEGKKEDTTGDPALAHAVARALWENKPDDLEIAVQCCEHLNRALIVEKSLMLTRGLEEVQVIPVPEAGGTFAAISWSYFSNPVVVEAIAGHMGIDIGLTMIGMHLKPVVKPIVLSTEYVGKARVVAARTRPRLIGGERARYR
ncbi:MAG: TIGR01440 family protein [Syntrophothermus sp.]|uniref:TIGR01440 family protein n=1 Tax=Syntrophothermus sp. TaxID=2736299 RepID=UPI00257CC475|nr:TIGR01440 family protein [Syntrophothermus sp.]NSW83296.1 TIGR01440 family protein [Syntrophothermus sp.]